MVVTQMTGQDSTKTIEIKIFGTFTLSNWWLIASTIDQSNQCWTCTNYNLDALHVKSIEVWITIFLNWHQGCWVVTSTKNYHEKCLGFNISSKINHICVTLTVRPEFVFFHCSSWFWDCNFLCLPWGFI